MKISFFGSDKDDFSSGGGGIDDPSGEAVFLVHPSEDSVWREFDLVVMPPEIDFFDPKEGMQFVRIGHGDHGENVVQEVRGESVEHEFFFLCGEKKKNASRGV